MVMNNPMDLTQGDIKTLMEAGQTIAQVPGMAGGNSPLGGISDMMELFDKGISLFERFNQSVDTFGMTIARLRGYEGGNLPPVEGQFFPQGTVIDGDIYRPPERTTNMPDPGPEPDPHPQPEPEPVPAVDPMKIYSKALGWLAELPGEMTMKEALGLAKAQKPLILGAIEKELPNLIGTSDGPSQ